MNLKLYLNLFLSQYKIGDNFAKLINSQIDSAEKMMSGIKEEVPVMECFTALTLRISAILSACCRIDSKSSLNLCLSLLK